MDKLLLSAEKPTLATSKASIRLQLERKQLDRADKIRQLEQLVATRLDRLGEFNRNRLEMVKKTM